MEANGGKLDTDITTVVRSITNTGINFINKVPIIEGLLVSVATCSAVAVVAAMSLDDDESSEKTGGKSFVSIFIGSKPDSVSVFIFILYLLFFTILYYYFTHIYTKQRISPPFK